LVKEKSLGVEILGPAPAPLEKLRDQFRFHLLMKSNSLANLSELCQMIDAKRAELSSRGCSLIIDVDPDSLL
jgi:primosomal protein N' (replication factor Y)